jgi:hypothetical protein
MVQMARIWPLSARHGLKLWPSEMNAKTDASYDAAAA